MRARGFTLVEVMVALAIVAIALPAVLMALYQQIDDTAYLRDKSIAHMVAANKLAEMRLVIASTRVLNAGKDNGTATMANRDWHWWVETKTTPEPKYFRIEIQVAPEQENAARGERPPKYPLYSLTAFMSGDLQEDKEGLPNPLDPGKKRSGEPTDESTGGTDSTQQNQQNQQDLNQGASQDVNSDGT